MKVEQIFNIVNSVTEEVTGETGLLNEDLSNVVDVGTAIFNADAFDNYVRSLINHIGKVIFVARPYDGIAPSVLMDSWEYGSILEKISSEMPVAVENPTWNLVDGQSYDPNIFRQPKVEAKFFNKRTTFEIDRSITERQVKESFSNSTQLNAFISMLFNEVQKSLTVKTSSLVLRTINNMIGETIINANPVRSVNLLTMYNTAKSADLTVVQAITNPDFIRYASYIMGLYMDRLGIMSTLFNIGGKQRFTPKSMLHFVMLSEFSRAADMYLQSDVFHDQYTALASHEIVPFWQGSGEGFSFADTSTININLASNSAKAVNQSGILAVMFDRDALGVTNIGDRVTTNYNAKGEFTNYFYKREAGYFNDTNENFVVFYVAEAA